jgi:hypothetical protein
VKQKLPDAVIVAYSVLCGATKMGCRGCGLAGEAGGECLDSTNFVSFAAARRILRAYRTEPRPSKEAK